MSGRVHRATPPARHLAWVLALRLTLSLILLPFGPSTGAAAQGGTDTVSADIDARTTASRAAPTHPDSPRAALRKFLQLTRAARYDSAAASLETSMGLGTTSKQRARELRAVLDRRLHIDITQVSGSAMGDTADGLAPGVDELGSIASGDGETWPVHLARSSAPDDDRQRRLPAWRFSTGTVDRVSDWYAELEEHWVLEHLPATLLRTGPLGIWRWQWLAIPMALALAVLIGGVLGRVARNIVRRMASRTRSQWDDEVLRRLEWPASVAFGTVAFAALVSWLSLGPAPEAPVYRVVRGALYVDFFWALWRLVDVVRNVLSSTRWAVVTASSRSLIPLGTRVAKVAVLALSVVALLSLLGYPVASLVAGLGLGGLALALAVQKTVENLFGAFSLGVDQPFRENDFVKIEEFVGAVEAIGLRSTRFRTLDRTLISIPNGRLADMRIESLTARDRLRLSTVIGLAYETTASQMRTVLAGFEKALREQPRLWPDALTIRFRGFAESSLDIEVMAWFMTVDWNEFQRIREEVLIGFMGVVEQAGTSLAFPTRTLHVASLPWDPTTRAGNGAAPHAPLRSTLPDA